MKRCPVTLQAQEKPLSDDSSWKCPNPALNINDHLTRQDVLTYSELPAMEGFWCQRMQAVFNSGPHKLEELKKKQSGKLMNMNRNYNINQNMYFFQSLGVSRDGKK